jgi:hypothetical protein
MSGKKIIQGLQEAIDDVARPALPPVIVGWDLSNGIETHVESVIVDGVIHIIDTYQIIDAKAEPTDAEGGK